MSRSLIGLALASAIVLAAPTHMAVAGGDAAKTIAGILSHLNHFPGDKEKQALTAITSDGSASAGEKALAHALLNFSHMVSDGDQKALAAVAADAKESDAVREMARILSNTHHMVSPEDQGKLKGMM